MTNGVQWDMKLIDVLQFTCPQCGSHCYGSFRREDGKWTRGCHGYAGDDLKPCDFKWKEEQDNLYMKPTGEKMPEMDVAICFKLGERPS